MEPSLGHVLPKSAFRRSLSSEMTARCRAHSITSSARSDRTAALVRETYANTIITGEDIRNGFVDFLDEPQIDFEEGVTPELAAAEICRRIRLSINSARDLGTA
jgi:hypothetical protein